MKVCSKCGIEKDESEFSNSSFTKDGKSWRCKDCCNENKRLRSLKRKSASGIGATTTCSTLRKHHEKMKDDPERLSTEFLQILIGRRCE